MIFSKSLILRVLPFFCVFLLSCGSGSINETIFKAENSTVYEEKVAFNETELLDNLSFE